MLSARQLRNCSDFSHELKLRTLASDDRVSIVYIHGTARSGSTIAEIVLAQLADLAIHQPFRGTLQKFGGRFRATKLDDDVDVYDSACGVIVDKINRCLQTRNKITVVIKELAGFFKPSVWQRWLKIPQKFLFTIREPHLQYMSWLSAMTDKAFQGNGSLQSDRDFVISNTKTIENYLLSAEWEGTTLSCNHTAWQALRSDFKTVKQSIDNTHQKVAILDSILLRYNPESAIRNAVQKLEFQSEKLSSLNLIGLAKTRTKVWDIRDKNRPMVRKANSSNTINPLTVGEAVSLNLFPEKSQNHIKSIIPIYLDLLYAEDRVYFPSLAELEPNETTGLIDTHPFLAYAIALFHLQDKKQANDWFLSMATKETIANFQSSIAIVDRYWSKTAKIHEKV